MKNQLYTDFDLSMVANENGDIRQLSDEECIIQVIKNSCNLNSFDIPFNSYYATNIRKYLFENPNKIQETEIKKSIRNVLLMDNRLVDPEVTITYSENMQLCFVDITVYVVILNKKVSYQLEFDRVR